jgi:hypothetical protein
MCSASTHVKLVVFAILALVANPRSGSAEEPKHIALLEFEGPKAVSVRGDVMRIAATRGWVTSASKLDGRSVQEFAEDYEIELVIAGTIEKRARDYRIRIRFVRGDTGATVGRLVSAVKQPSVDAPTKKRVERELARVLKAIPARASDDTQPAIHARAAP